MGRLISLPALQIVACIVGALAGLVPVIEWTRPFWGLADYAEFSNSPPSINRVMPDSPAGRAGFLDGDTILTGAGRPMKFGDLAQFERQMRPGEAVVFRVQRTSGEMDLTARGDKPRLGALYYPTSWYPVLGGICLAVGLLTVAMRRRISRWRPAVVIIVGLGLAGEAGRQEHLAREGFDAAVRMPWILYERQFRAGGQIWEFHQSRVGMAVSLALALLACVELCRLIWRRREAK